MTRDSYCDFHKERRAVNLCEDCGKEICEKCVREWEQPEYDFQKTLCPLCYIETKQEKMGLFSKIPGLPIPIAIVMMVFAVCFIAVSIWMIIFQFGMDFGPPLAFRIVFTIPFVAVPGVFIFVGVKSIIGKRKYKDYEKLIEERIAYNQMLGPEYQEDIKFKSSNSSTKEEERYCEYCGALIEEGKTKCSNCGAFVTK
ncbi:MAG: hypothetical protein U9O98_02425 [Asgard group archaeon]|nr:hypothetical protein [Asgard group archaeon]